MKSFFSPQFLVLTVVVLLSVVAFADPYVPPTSDLVVLREMPNYAVQMPFSLTPLSPMQDLSENVRVWLDIEDLEEILSKPAPFSSSPMAEQSVAPVSYTVAKPPEIPMALPEPLVSAPLLPTQERIPSLTPVWEETSPLGTIRGQAPMERLEDIMNTAVPHPRGLVPDGTIDPGLIDSSDSSDLDPYYYSRLPLPDKSGGVSGQPSSTAPTDDQLGNGALVLATIMTTLGLVYMAFMAYEYRQRWMLSMTAQNDRYIGGGTFDMDMDNMYGGSTSVSDGFGFSEGGFGLVRRPI